MTVNLEGKPGLERKFWLREMGGWLYSNSLIPVRGTSRQPARLLPPVMPSAQDAGLQSWRSRQGDRPLIKLQWRPQCAGEEMKWRWGSKAGRQVHGVGAQASRSHPRSVASSHLGATQPDSRRGRTKYSGAQKRAISRSGFNYSQSLANFPQKNSSGKYFHFVVTLLFHSDTTN